MTENYLNYIGGEWMGAQNGETIPNINPADNDDIIGHLAKSGDAEAKAAIAAASEAFETWRRVPAPKRADYLFEVWRIMAGRKEEIGRALAREEGKVLAEAIGEVQKTLNVLEYQAGLGRRISGYSRESEMPGNYAYTRREPLGVCALITPWNFPVCIPAWKIAPALVAGNTVVFKPAALTPASADLVVKCFIDAGLPGGVLNLIQGQGRVVGETLINAPEVAAISFTGSNSVGQHCHSAGAARGIPVQCEMGGKNPIIVLEDADVAQAASAAAKGGFGSTGQRCTATSRAVVHESVADEFVALLKQHAEAMVPGNPLESGTTMGPSVSADQLETVLNYIEIGKNEAALVTGGGRLTDGALGRGFFPAPTIFDYVTADCRIAQEEIFGPVISVLRVKNFDEAMDVANNVEFGLSSSIYTNNYRNVMHYVERIETGICHVNSPTMGGEAHMPFGGMKSTGVGGREMNEEALEFYTELKTVYFDYTGAGREGNLY
jgi:acyl-CoA reductase-like NAD-dependent aldehyde dehydrogenase